MITASSLTSEHIGRILVMGVNSKTRRGVIRDIQSNGSLVRIQLEANGTRWHIFSPADELTIEN